MPVIVVTQEAEIKRIAAPSQPRQIVLKTLSQKIPNTARYWWLVPVFLATQEAEMRRIMV
jgi:hypothetical protein